MFRIKKNAILLILAIFILFSLIPNIFAMELDDNTLEHSIIADENSIYVSTTGNDDGDGSLSNPYNSISSAVDAYNSTVNSNIYIKNGNYDITSQIILEKDITIVGESRDGVILNGNGQSAIFKVTKKTTTVLNSLTFENAYDSQATQYSGSAVYVYNDIVSMLVDNCIFKNNKNATFAAYDYFASGTITIQNSQFLGNEKVHKSWDYGSAISIGGKYSLNVFNTTFINNTATPIYLYNNAVSAVFDNCKFINNTADLYSTIRAYYAGNIQITGTEFRGNVAGENGYLIYDESGNRFNLTLGNNIIENNSPDSMKVSDKINVIYLDNNAKLEANDVNMLEGQDRTFAVKLTDDEGNAIAGKEILITLTNYYNKVFTFNATTNASGIASINLKDQKFGKYKTVSSFAGDSQYDACSLNNTIAISTEADYNMIFDPEYVKMLEGSSFVVTGIVTDSYGEPDNAFDGANYEIRWVNHDGGTSVINGNYYINASTFTFDLSRCHLISQDELYHVNFTAVSNSVDYSASIVGSLPVDLSRDMPPIDPDAEVIWVSVDGNDETGDGSENNPLETVQLALYVNMKLGGGKTIHVTEGLYNISIYTLNDKVTVVGEGSKTILRQDIGRLGMFSIENENTVRFVNLTFTNGFATPVPGSLITVTEHSTVYIDGCEFYDNHAIRGGAISIDDSNVYVTNSYFHNNSALLQASQGGAIWVTSGVLQVTDTLFEDNEATLGGAIYASYDADTYILNCTFVNNTAVATSLTYGGGGAIFTQSSVETIIENSSFIGNYAELYGGAIYVYGGITDITTCYFDDNNVGFGTDKGSTIHVLPLASTVKLNVSHSIFFTEDDYNKIIYVDELEEDNESTFEFENNYWGGQQKAFVSVNKAVSKWVIMQADKDTAPVNKGDIVKITAEFISTDVNGTIYDLSLPVHDLLIHLSPNIGEVNPKIVVIHNNIAEFEYYANNEGYEYINFTSDYARHFVYSFNVIDSDKQDLNANITINPSKTTTINVEVPEDIENNITISVGSDDYSVKATNGHALKVLGDLAPGNYSVTVTYDGDDKYKAFINKTYFIINKDLSQLSVDIQNITFGDLLAVKVNVTKGATGSVIVNINNKNYTIELNNSEGIRYISNMAVGNYTAYAKYVGDNYYEPSTANTTFEVIATVPVSTLYVSTKGSDENGNGSADNPYATISKALDRNNALGGNKTIIVSEGNYVLNRYSLVDSVKIIANGSVLVYANSNVNHLYIGGDVDVTLNGITFANGNGYASGSIDMGSSNDNSLKNLTIVNCTFIDNKGPVGAIISYANTKIIQTNFINNTATGNSGSVQGIVNIRDNSIDISYSNFVGNRMASDLIVFSNVNGNANYNFWANNSKPTDKVVSINLNKDIWVILSPSINDSEIVLKHNYDVSVEFKSTSDGVTLNDLKEFMPDVEVTLDAKIGKLSPETITVHENSGVSRYNIYSLETEVIDVYVQNDKVTNLTFNANIPEEDKIYVDVNGNDLNNGTRNNPLKTIEAAILQNKLMGGNKTIIVGNGTFKESNLIANDLLNIIGNENSIIITDSFTINNSTSISGLTFINSSIKHDDENLEIYNSRFINSKVTSLGENLEIYNSEFVGEGVVSSANTIIDNTQFKNITSKALEIENNAEISNSKFENNDLAIDIKKGNANIINNEFKSNKDLININDETILDSNVFEDNLGAIDVNANAVIINNQFSGENINVNSTIDVKNNTDVKYDLIDGSISNTIITYLGGQTTKVDGGFVCLNATVTDDMGNSINGGILEFTVDGILAGESDVIEGVAKFNKTFESGEYTISGASYNFPKSKIISALLRVDVINYWFIGDVGYETLYEAVDAAVDGDVIKGVPGSYIINEISIGHRPTSSEPWTVTKSITITSLNETPVTLEGNGGRILFVDTGSNLTLKNLILANCHNDGDVKYGGVVDVFLNGQLNVDNCSFINNSADQGGAISAYGEVNIINSKFINNTAGLVGGAIYKDFYGDLVIENTSFVNSFASSFGGAIHLIGDDDTDNYIINCIFDANTGFRGGALYAGGANLTVINSTFTSNKALRVLEDYEDEDAIGGAFYNYYANVGFYNSKFINNSAQDCGGAMELDNTVTSIGSYYDPTITIYFTGIDNCTFINNTADDGGAIYMGYAGAPFVLISNSLFEGNTAIYDSAAIANIAGFLSLTNDTFRQNTAGLDNLIDVYGTDDLYNEYDAYIFADNCTFENNNVNFDIYIANFYSFGEIFNSTFIGETTVLSNRGFTNVTSTIIKDSKDESKYVINNFGSLGLENNTFDYPIYSDYYISTPTYIVVLNNETHNVAIGSDYTITALVLDDNGNRIEGNNFVFVVDGVEMNVTLVNHIFTAQYTVTEGTHIVDVNYTEYGLQNVTIKTGTIISGIPAEMNITVNNITEGETLVVDVSIVDDATGTIIVSVNNKTYSTDIKNGKASVSIPDLKVGNHEIKVTYSGDDKYPENSKIINATVAEQYQNASVNITSDDITEGENLTINVNLPEDATGNVTAKINGKDYTVPVVNGTATITIPDLGVGNYTVPVTYSGDDKYNPVTRYLNVSVNEDTSDKILAPDVTKYYHGAERFVVSVTDYKGNPIPNKSVNITINGVTYHRTTDDSGNTSIAIGLNSGVYNVTVDVDNATVYSVVTVLTTVNGTDLVKVYRNESQYYATFRDSQGNYLKEGTMIRFNINGVFYDRTVGEKGLAKLNINLQQGVYILTATNFETGEESANIITVIPRIVENRDITKYFRNGTQYSVKILDDQGKAVGAGESVTFNINGVFYTRITDENGIAQLNINLDAGDYIITTQYRDCVVSNNIKVIHCLSANDISMSYRDGTQFEARLVDGQGNPYANKEILFNINGVFYTRTTDVDGIARLNINLIPGEYIITSSFNGEYIGNTVKVN